MKDFNDVILYTSTFEDAYFTKSFKEDSIKAAKEQILNQAFKDADLFKGVINDTQFKAVCNLYKDKIRKIILS